MKSSMILDCTLRDGAYLIDKNFGTNTITGIIGGLVNARVDWIEMGFLQDNEFGEGKTVFLNSKDAERYVPVEHGKSKFAVFADYSRYTINKLDHYTGTSFDAVRACFFKQERKEVLDFCKEIKEKGYELFVQPVDALGYSDEELKELIDDINSICPYCFSIVDTFGSMYEDDLHRVFELIDSKLMSGCRIGFHSHNNLQMSSALAQAFIKMSFGRREVIVDATISGMGRGAGNTPTELISQYLVSKWGYNYEIDAILDVIDTYMDNLRTRCTWGYSTPFFIAGSYGAHVNNIDYLIKKNSIRSKDIRYILNNIGEKRKRYDYTLLEAEYINYMRSNIEDSGFMDSLRGILSDRNVVIIAPGKSARIESESIREYILQKKAISISVNFFPEYINTDFLYMNNVKRYNSQKGILHGSSVRKIYTSNIKNKAEEGEFIVSFNRLIKYGWEHMDNSTIMLMRMLNQLDVKEIAIAGFDGYDFMQNHENYAEQELELSSPSENPDAVNREIAAMLKDFNASRKPEINIKFVTSSRFEQELID